VRYLVIALHGEGKGEEPIASFQLIAMRGNKRKVPPEKRRRGRLATSDFAETRNLLLRRAEKLEKGESSALHTVEVEGGLIPLRALDQGDLPGKEGEESPLHATPGTGRCPGLVGSGTGKGKKRPADFFRSSVSNGANMALRLCQV